MTCNNCGTENRNEDMFCKSCGAPLTPNNEEKLNEDIDATIGVSSAQENNAEPAEDVTSEVTAVPAEEKSFEDTTEKPAEESSFEDTVAMPPQEGGSAEGVSEEDDPFKVDYKKKKKKKKRIIILSSLLVVIALLAGAAVLFWAELVNFVKGFSSPADHQLYVYSEVTDELTDCYKTYLLDRIAAVKDSTAEAEITFEVSETAIGLLEGLGAFENSDFDLDLSALNDTSITYTATTNKGLFALDLWLNIPDFPLNFVLGVDMNKELVTLEMPDVTDKALATKPEQGALSSSMGQTELLTALVPDEELAASLIERYIETIFSEIKDVTRETESYTVNGTKHEATCFTSTIDEATSERVKSVLINTIKDDKEIRKHFVDTFNEFINSDKRDAVVQLVYGSNAEKAHNSLSAEEYYDALIKKLDEDENKYAPDLFDIGSEDDVESDSSEETKTSVIKTYINSKGEIIAWSVTANEAPSDSETTFFFASVEDGDNIEFELRIEDKDLLDPEYSTKVVLAGKGTHKDNKFTGKMDITSEEYDYETEEVTTKKYASVDFTNFDTESLKKGIVNGKISLQSELISEMITESAGDFTGSEMLNLLTLTIDAKNTEAETDTVITLGAGLQDFLTVNIKGSVGEAQSITLPEEDDTVTDGEEWFKSFDTSFIMKLFSIFSELGLTDVSSML